ncbi:MAG: tyrosine-type recombinase/integrase [Gammaproteobacteria bacterium]
MPLTDTAIRNAKPGEKPVKLFDGGGLYLLVNPNGSRWWRFDYRFAGKRRTLSMGVYPAVGLKQARDKRDAARKQLAAGIDPGLARKAERSADADSFEPVAREWHAKRAPGWAPGHAEKVLGRLERDVFPWLGSRPVSEVKAPELLAVLRRIETRGALELAHRAHQICGQVFRYAVATGRAERNPATDIRGALPPAKQRHHAAITDPKDVGALLRAIDGYRGSIVTQGALWLAPLTFVRPGELRKAEWGEIDLEAAEWRLPAERMKMRATHIVPLSRQAVEALRELHPLTGSGRYVFPSERTRDRPMSENTVNAGLRRMGYAKDEMTGHGFRSMASTLLNEQGWHRDAIERQLAHGERDAVRAAYNYAEHLPERRKMMQAWADYLDKLKAGAEVVPLHYKLT